MEDKNKYSPGADGPKDDERLNFAPPPKPFTPAKIVELALCALAVILGLVYINTDIISLGVLLPVFCVFFSTVPVLRWIDAKKSGAGFVSFIPAMCWGFLALCVIFVTILYFVAGK